MTSLENLALACVSCSLRKGPRTTAIDPTAGDAAQLFHPRLNAWNDHFHAAESGEIVGLTAIGRATIAALSTNRVLAVAIRREERSRDRWPLLVVRSLPPITISATPEIRRDHGYLERQVAYRARSD